MKAQLMYKTLLLCILFFSLSQIAVTQYTINNWTTENGLPQNSVNAIIQDQRGYLLLGTFGGLVKFDGVRFSKVDILSNKILSDRILSLYRGRDETIWIGTEGGGLAQFRNDSVHNYTTTQGLDDNVVMSLCEDQNGVLWIGTRNGLNKLKNGIITRVPLMTLNEHRWVYLIARDKKGTLWIDGGEDVFRISPDGDIRKVKFGRVPGSYASAFLGEDRFDQLWFRCSQTIGRMKDHLNPNAPPQEEFHIRRDYIGVIQDSSNVYWLWAQTSGLFRADKDLVTSKFIQCQLPSGKKDFRIRCAFIDKEGNRWFGTEGDGLVRVKDKLFDMISVSQGISNEIIEPVMEDSKGNIWVGTNCGGLNRISPDGHIKIFAAAQGVANECIWSLAEDHQGNVWVGSYGNGAYRYDGKIFHSLTMKDGLSNDVVLAILVDHKGHVWLGTDGGGLNEYFGGKFVPYTQANGLVDNSVRYIYEDTDKSLWIGTVGGLSHLTNGHFTNYTTANGLTKNYVRAIYRDIDSNLWIGTYGGGLLRLKEGIFQSVLTNNGLFDNTVSSIIVDDEDFLWMSCNRGIFKTIRKRLVDFVDGKIDEISCRVYGVDEGLASNETNGGFQPAVWKTRDNRLLYPTIKGVAVLPLRRAQISFKMPPPVHIERVIINQTHFPLNQPIEIPYGDQQIEIQYTALSFIDPQHLIFKYRMEGLEHKWVDARYRRAAFYSGIPPGNYHFQVIASSTEGVWNLDGAVVTIIMEPPFWETWSFRISVFFGFLIICFSFYQRWRIRREQDEQARLELSWKMLDSAEQERKRIAVELHDSIGQELLIIKNRALLALQKPYKKKNVLEQVNEISSMSSQVIDQTRDISYNLRPYQIDRLGIKKALESIVARIAQVSHLKFSTNIDLIDGKIPKDWEIHLYRIVQEGLNRIVRHAQATEFNVRIFLHDRRITIDIKDNGRGFNISSGKYSEILLQGLGLQGIAERARTLGGTLHIDSHLGKGTQIKIEIPLERTQYGKK